MKKLILIPGFVLVFSTQIFASGLSKAVIVGPKAIGMGGAFVGIADDPTTIFHNPAGMSRMEGRNIELGMDALITQEDYTPPSGTKESVDSEFLPIPQFGYVSNLGKVALGLGVFFPHGNGGKYSAPSAVSSNPLEGRIYSMEIDPAFSIQIFKGLSVGGNIRITRVSSSLKGQLFAPGLTLDDLEVSGWGIGGSVGALYKPCKMFSFGLNWRSKVEADLGGTAKFTPGGNSAADYTQTLPTLLTAGIGLVPMDKLTVGISYDFENNSEIKQLDVKLNGVPAATIPQNYTDSHTIHIGGEYWLFPAIALRAGYAKDLNHSIPDSTMNRIVGDIDASEVSAGFAYKYTRYTFGATWNARFGSRTVPATGLAPGKYEAFINSISVGVEASI